MKSNLEFSVTTGSISSLSLSLNECQQLKVTFCLDPSPAAFCQRSFLAFYDNHRSDFLTFCWQWPREEIFKFNLFFFLPGFSPPQVCGSLSRQKFMVVNPASLASLDVEKDVFICVGIQNLLLLPKPQPLCFFVTLSLFTFFRTMAKVDTMWPFDI